MIIEDGTGRRNKVGVSNENRLLTADISTSLFQHYSHEGRGFLASSPIIELTSSNASGIFYFKTRWYMVSSH